MSSEVPISLPLQSRRYSRRSIQRLRGAGWPGGHGRDTGRGPVRRPPIVGVLEVDARADNILERAAQRRQAGADLVENIDGLTCSIAGADRCAASVRCGRAADEDLIADADRAA